MTSLLNIGTAFLSLSFWLWSLALLASGFMLLRGYFLLSYLWHLPERMPKMSESLTSKAGVYEYWLNPPPKKLTAGQIAKMMLLLGAVLLAYDHGIRAKKSHDYAAWQARYQQWERIYGNQISQLEHK